MMKYIDFRIMGILTMIVVLCMKFTSFTNSCIILSAPIIIEAVYAVTYYLVRPFFGTWIEHVLPRYRSDFNIKSFTISRLIEAAWSYALLIIIFLYYDSISKYFYFILLAVGIATMMEFFFYYNSNVRLGCNNPEGKD